MLEDCWQISLPGPVTWYAMTYTCGPSDGRLADFHSEDRITNRRRYQPARSLETDPKRECISEN
jgi:hypothetical protein